MVLLLLTLGSLLLEGLNLQQRVLLAQTASETQAIRDTAIAHSALQWGKQQVCRRRWRWPAGAGAAGLARLSAYLRRRFTGAQQRQRRGAGLAVRRGARRAGAFFRPRLERFLPAQRGELCQMP